MISFIGVILYVCMYLGAMISPSHRHGHYWALPMIYLALKLTQIIEDSCQVKSVSGKTKYAQILNYIFIS